jgi:hypothetical protein
VTQALLAEPLSFLTVQLFEVVVRFVDIGGIVDHLS